MNHKLSLSYAILDNSTSAVTVLFPLEFGGLIVCGELQGGGSGLFQAINLWKDDGDKLIFKIAWCLPNVTLVSYSVN